MENERGSILPIDSLIVLAALREQKRLGADELARRIHRDPMGARRTLEQLVEAGLVQAHGNTRGRSYTLSANVYRTGGKGNYAAYTRQAGFDDLQREQMVLNYIRQHGCIHRNEVIELCLLNTNQAANLLKRLKVEGKLVMHGKRRGAFYTLEQNEQL